MSEAIMSIRHALGVGRTEEKTARDGTKINVTDDAYYNLMGALDDMKNGINDDIVRRTVERVVNQLAMVSLILDGD